MTAQSWRLFSSQNAFRIEKRPTNPEYRFRQHLRDNGGAIEE